jgi:hypothetical protein
MVDSAHLGHVLLGDHQVDAELHVEAAHAFWWLRLWNNVSTNGVMLVLGVTLALVGLLAWTTLLEVREARVCCGSGGRIAEACICVCSSS